MNITNLPIIIKESQKRFIKIQAKFPKIRAYLMFSTRDGQAPIGSSLEYLLDDCEHFFVENEYLIKTWGILDELWELNEELHSKRTKERNAVPTIAKLVETLKASYLRLVPFIEMHDEVEICLRWDEIDFEINSLLGVDPTLVDVHRSNSQIGGIKICLGTIRKLYDCHVGS